MADLRLLFPGPPSPALRFSPSLPPLNYWSLIFFLDIPRSLGEVPLPSPPSSLFDSSSGRLFSPPTGLLFLLHRFSHDSCWPFLSKTKESTPFSSPFALPLFFPAPLWCDNSATPPLEFVSPLSTSHGLVSDVFRTGTKGSPLPSHFIRPLSYSNPLAALPCCSSTSTRVCRTGLYDSTLCLTLPLPLFGGSAVRSAEGLCSVHS